MNSDNDNRELANGRVQAELLQLAHACASFEKMAILGEGNVSGKLTDQSFLIKASGTQLSSLSPDQLVEVETLTIQEAVSQPELDDKQVDSLLLRSRVNCHSLKPSVETLFHAWLLELPGIAFVGHTHPVHVNSLLCSPHAKDYAAQRLFPDQVVYCGQESVLIPYVDPGMELSRRIAEEVQSFIERTSSIPKTICLENHGLIAIGATARQVEAALLMAEKSAKIYLGAIKAGAPQFLPKHQVERISARSDEHYRQKMLEGNPKTYSL